MENIFTLRIENKIVHIPIITSCVEQAARVYHLPEKEILEMKIATEEAIMNLIKYAFAPDEKNFIEVSIEIGYLDFTVVIRDKGKPFDFFALEKSKDSVAALSLKILQKIPDSFQILNLGSNGREQRICKRVIEMPNYEQSVPAIAENEPAIEKNINFEYRLLRKEEAIEISQCIYDEFGYSYPNELLYYPEQFYAACERGDIYSLVAVAPSGEVAGHLALMKMKNIPGVSEICIAVVKRKYRKRSIMQHLMKKILEKAKEELYAVMGQPVLYHPISQHLLQEYNFEVCGFIFNYTPKNFSNTYLNVQRRCNVGIAILPIKHIERSITIPEELKPLIESILKRMQLKRTINTEASITISAQTIADFSINVSTRVARIDLESSGQDIEYVIKQFVLQAKKEQCAIVEVLVNLCDPSNIIGYKHFKQHQFFFTGIFPNAMNEDYLIMELILEGVGNYDKIQTIEPYTSLLEKIKALDPNYIPENT